MLYKNIFKFVFFMFCSGLILCCGNSVKGQSQVSEKPKLKDFGASLRTREKKNAEKPVVAAKTKTVDDSDEIIKVETNLVRKDVLVVDRRGKAVIGLKAEDFIVTENGVAQEIGTFSLGESVEVPKSVVLIIDYSGSQIPFIKNSVEAAKVLVDKLNPADRMAIVTDDVELLTGFTKDKRLLKEKLDGLTKKTKWEIGDDFPMHTGKSLQFSALMATLNELFDDEDARPIVIFQTDGDEAFSLNDDNRSRSAYERVRTKLGIRFTIAELFARIDKSRATIYSVVTDHSMLNLSPEERLEKATRILIEEIKESEKRYKSLNFKLGTPQDIKNHAEKLYNQQKAMMIVARASGGFTQGLEKPEQAGEIYSRILNDINNRYLIGYYPKNEARDGKRRNVKIEVRNRPEYIVLGRKTYYAPDSGQ